MGEQKERDKIIGHMLVDMVAKTLLDTHSWFVRLDMQDGHVEDIAREYIQGITKLNEKLRKDLIKKHGLDIS